GTWGDAGVWSFAATKTVSTGEGGMLVSARDEVLEFGRSYRDYGKPDFHLTGLNFRMNEFTSALGLVQARRVDEIAAWKNAIARRHLDQAHPGRVELPDGMTSGLYKYIVFDPIERSTGKVYDTPCHRITGAAVELPNTDWVAQNHWCVPLYYRPSAGKEDSLASGGRSSAAAPGSLGRTWSIGFALAATRPGSSTWCSRRTSTATWNLSWATFSIAGPSTRR